MVNFFRKYFREPLSTRRSALLTLALLATFPIALSGVRAQRVGRASSLDILPLPRTFDCENGMADMIWNSHYTADPGDSVTAPKSRAGTLDLRAGYNQVFGNSAAQIAITTSGANVWVFRDDITSPPCTWSTTYAGLNDIYQYTTGGYSGRIEGLYSGAPANPSVDIGNNYWGSGIDPQSSPPPSFWPYFNFSASVSAVTIQSIPGDLECGSPIIKMKGDKSLSSPSIDTTSCGNAYEAAYVWDENTINPGAAYDTMKWYITHCYQIANAGETWGNFGDSFDSVGQSPAGRDSIFNFVLYGLGLRSDDEWFCDGVPLLGVKYDGSGSDINYRDNRAILNFLMDNPRCAFNYRNDSIGYAGLLRGQWNLWADTSQPGEVFDSSLPTLQQLGLDTLLHFAADAVYPITTSPIVLDARLLGNPTDADGLLWISIGREAYLHIDVYDLLGRPVQNAGYSGVFEQGTREIPLGMGNAPPGTYYVRIQTANNETKTLKLVKE